jgi:hypothetical protein
MELIRDVNIYTLPQEVASVRQVFRRTFGDSTGPFASQTLIRLHRPQSTFTL